MEINYSYFGEWFAANKALLATLAGSLTCSYFDKSITTWREKLASFVFGGLAALVLAQPVNDYLHLGENATGYVMGYFGLNICAACLKAIRRFGDNADFWTLFRESVSSFVCRVNGYVSPAQGEVPEASQSTDSNKDGA